MTKSENSYVKVNQCAGYTRHTKVTKEYTRRRRRTLQSGRKTEKKSASYQEKNTFFLKHNFRLSKKNNKKMLTNFL